MARSTVAMSIALALAGPSLLGRHLSALAMPHADGSVAVPLMSAEPLMPGNQSHLYFYWVNKAANQCGEVDAAPYMPKDLFEPSHTLQLLAYVQATISLFGIKSGPQPGDLKLGRCKDHGFAVDGHQEIGATWTPMDLQGPICMKRCKCQWWDTHGSPVSGYKPAAAAGLHNCTDVPDDPATGHFCSLCGPSAPGNCGGKGGACSIGIAIWRPYVIFLTTFDVRAVFAAFSSRVRLPVVFFSLLMRRLCGHRGTPARHRSGERRTIR